jgi:hypothetical protein
MSGDTAEIAVTSSTGAPVVVSLERVGPHRPCCWPGILRGARPGFAVPALCVPAAEALVLRRVVARARGALFSPLESAVGVAGGSRRSISSATARRSATAARATRCAFLPALPLTPLSAFAACLRRPTCRRRSNRSASFLAIIFLLALREMRGRNPIEAQRWRDLTDNGRGTVRTQHAIAARTGSASNTAELHLDSELKVRRSAPRFDGCKPSPGFVLGFSRGAATPRILRPRHPRFSLARHVERFKSPH